MAESPAAIEVFEVTWAGEPGPFGWLVEVASDEEPEFVTIGPAPPAGLRLPRDSGDLDPRGVLEAWIAGSDLLDWWLLSAAEGVHDKAFVLRDFPDGTWQLPWELLLQKLSARGVHRRVSLARRVEGPRPEAPTRFAEQLKVMILTGQPAGLDLDGEVEGIVDAWASLGHEARKLVAKPERREAFVDTLSDQLREHPHVVWFSGHGRVTDEAGTELLFADGTWVGASELAGAIADAGYPAPLYAVFWACDTGSAGHVPSDAGSAFTPQLFSLLRDCDVVDAVVAQAPIGDGISKLLAREVFANLAAGRSLTAALTRARAEALDELRRAEEAGGPPSPRFLDWAVPVHWTSGTPVAALAWGATTQVRSQLLGEALIRSTDNVAALHDEADAKVRPSPDELDRAASWLAASRTWVSGDVADGERRNEFLRVLQAVQARSPLTVLLVDAHRDGTGRELQRWVEDVHARVRVGSGLPVALTRAMKLLGDSVMAGWPELASVAGLCLAVVNPPDTGADWFWQPLTGGARHGPTVVFSAGSPDPATGDWQFDALPVRAAPDDVLALFDAAPRLARALSVLEVPLPQHHLALVNPKPGEVGAVSEWPGADQLLVEVRSAYVMASTARSRIKPTTPRKLRTAHRDAAAMLHELPMRSRADIAERILSHLLAGGDLEASAGYANALVGEYWEAGRPRRLLSVANRLGDRRGLLSQWAAVRVAHAHMGLGESDAAGSWLRAAEPDAPLDQALQHSVWAQVRKSEGTAEAYAEAREHIEEAIRIALEAGDRSMAWDYQQDRALLLQHNFGERREAAAVYGELITAIEADGDPRQGTGAARQVAVIKRNYAECLRMLSEEGQEIGDDDPDRLLEEAAQHVGDQSSAPIRADILYEQARNARSVEEEIRLLERCRQVTREIGYAMLEAVVENALFWLGADGMATGWEAVEAQLEPFAHHAHAGRTLIKGRLLAAKRLPRPEARAQLSRNRQFVERKRIDGGTRDKLRIAQTYAGLAVLEVETGSGDRSEPWRGFAGWPWAASWLEDAGVSSAQEVWEMEVR